MYKRFNILRFIKERGKIFLTLCSVLFLASCGDDCPTVQEASTGSCPLCSLFEILTDSAAEMANDSWEALAPSLSQVVIVIAAIYIALYTLRMVSSFGKQTLADYFTGDKRGLFIFMFKATLIYLLLRGDPTKAFDSGDITFLRYVLGPLLSAGIEVGGVLSNAVPSGNRFEAIDVREWDDIFTMIYDSTVTFNNSVQLVSGLGEVMCCDAVVSWKPWEWKFLQLIYGTLLFCYGWILLIAISFYLLDVVIRLAFAATLLPLGITLALSHLSTAYAKSIWNMFINVFFSLIMLGIVMGFVIQSVFFCITGESAQNSPSFDMQAAIDQNSIAEMTNVLALLGHMLLTIICFAVLFQLIMQMNALAGKVSDTTAASEMNSAQEAMAPVAQSAVNAGKQTATWTGGALAKGGQQIGHDIARATRMDKLYKKASNKLEKIRGTVTGTGAQGYRAFWRKWFK